MKVSEIIDLALDSLEAKVGDLETAFAAAK
jgi:hypothetical protein